MAQAPRRCIGFTRGLLSAPSGTQVPSIEASSVVAILCPGWLACTCTTASLTPNGLNSPNEASTSSKDHHATKQPFTSPSCFILGHSAFRLNRKNTKVSQCRRAEVTAFLCWLIDLRTTLVKASAKWDIHGSMFWRSIRTLWPPTGRSPWARAVSCVPSFCFQTLGHISC